MLKKRITQSDTHILQRLSEAGFVTITLCLVTLCVTLAVSYNINGTVFKNVRVTQLEPYGGLTFAHLQNFELWRLVVAQLIHVKPLHMLYNVLSLFFLGKILERTIGSKYFLLTWFLTGSLGTLYSSLFVEPPWNLGTGGSQAIFGLCGLALVLTTRILQWNKYLVAAFIFAMLPALLLDMIFAHYPKPGHLMSFCLGLILGIGYSGSLPKRKEPDF